MTKWLSIFLQTLVSALQSQGDLAFENLLLRQQLAVMKRSCSRPSFSKPDRLFWGAPRIHGELLKLGLNVSEATVSKYMARHRRPPALSWRTFLVNHASDIVAIDFLTVPTATFRVLFVLVILSHDRRKILHTNVTEHPTTSWTARQVLEAIGLDNVPTYLLRDRDAIYGRASNQRMASVGLTEVVTAPRSPWQNPCVVTETHGRSKGERVVRGREKECSWLQRRTNAAA